MNTRTKPIVIAHRGASGYLPEHTLEAKVLAHAQGADFIEQDVVLTRDGTPIILHDIHLAPTTDVALKFPDRAREDGHYYAADFALDEIRTLCVYERSNPDGSPVYPTRFPAATGNFRVPTLEEEIDLIAGLDHSTGSSTGLYIELKAPNWHLKQGLDSALAILNVLEQKSYAGRIDRVFLQCFDDDTLRRLHQELKTPLPLIQLIGENDWGEDTGADYDYLQTAKGLAEISHYASGIGPWITHIYRGRDADDKAVLSELVESAHANGLLVHPYTLRRDELPEGISDFQQLMDMLVNHAKVDGLFTDFPELAVNYLRSNRELA